MKGTWFDFSSRDVGATAFQMPYRWRPLSWNVSTNVYINERHHSLINYYIYVI